MADSPQTGREYAESYDEQTESPTTPRTSERSPTRAPSPDPGEVPTIARLTETGGFIQPCSSCGLYSGIGSYGESGHHNLITFSTHFKRTLTIVHSVNVFAQYILANLVFKIIC